MLYDSLQTELQVAQLGKNLPALWETWVQTLGREDTLEKGKAIHSSILAWRTPWTKSMGWQRVGHDWATLTFTNYIICCGLSYVRESTLGRVDSQSAEYTLKFWRLQNASFRPLKTFLFQKEKMFGPLFFCCYCCSFWLDVDNYRSGLEGGEQGWEGAETDARILEGHAWWRGDLMLSMSLADKEQKACFSVALHNKKMQWVLVVIHT